MQLDVFVRIKIVERQEICETEEDKKRIYIETKLLSNRANRGVCKLYSELRCCN